MTLTSLIETLRSRRVELALAGDDLRCRAPRGSLTPELKQAISDNKQAILRFLREGASLDAAVNSVHGAILGVVDRDPSAVVVEAAGRAWTYGELRDRASGVTQRLKQAGVGPGIRVALQGDSAFDVAAGMLGILGAGAACVPFASTTPAPERVGAIAVHVAGDRVGVEGDLPPTEARLALSEDAAFVVAPVDAAHDPAAVVLEHGALAETLVALVRGLGIRADDVFPFDAGRLPWSLLLPLAAGARISTGPTNGSGAAPAHTVLVDTPTGWRRLLADDALPPRLRLAVSTGESLDRKLWRRLRAAGLEVANLYGAAGSPWIAWSVEAAEPEPDDSALLVPVGRPGPGTRVLILDRDLEPVGVLVPGDVYLAGIALPGRDGAEPGPTAARLVPDPHGAAAGGRLLATGDRGRRLADGTFEVLGRVDEREWMRKYRIEPRHVEAVLREHPDVRDAAAIVATTEDGRRLPQVRVELEPGADISMIELREALGEVLPSSLVAAALAAVDRLPLRSDGRIDRVELEARASGAALPRAQAVERMLPGEELDELCSRTNLTKNQLLVWAGQRLSPDLPIYNITAVATIQGEVIHEHLQRAFSALVDASDAMRGTIVERDGVPRFEVKPPCGYEIALLDFSDRADPAAEARAWAKARGQRAFDLETGLFESLLIKLAPGRWIWYLGQHHLITDAWSMGLSFTHVVELYRKLCAGEPIEALDLPAFADFVEFERRKREGAGYARSREYWKHKLADDPEPLEFFRGAGKPRGATVERVALNLGAERSAAMRALETQPGFEAASANLARFNAFTACLMAYLHRIAGARRISVGTPLLNRTTRRFKQTPGLFMQVAPLRVTLDEHETFRSLTGKINVEMLATMRHQRYATGNSPQRRVYDVLMNYETVGVMDFDGKAAAIESFKSHGGDKLALLVRDYEQSGSFALDIDFHHDAFDAAERERTLEHLLRTIDACLADPDAPLGRIRLPSAEEIRRVLTEFNPGGELKDVTGSVVERFEAAARRSPAEVAVVYEGQRQTYGELDAMSSALAAHLQSLGVGPEVRVGICLDRSLRLPQAVLGVWRAGGAYVPLDPEQSDERLRFVVEDAALELVVTEDRHADRFDGTQVLRLDADAARIASARPTARGEAFDPDRLAYAIYTSGSTGRPKGVMVTHRNLVCALEAWNRSYGLTALRSHLQMANFSFDVFAGDFVRALGSGARLVLCPQERLWSPDRLDELMRREAIDLAEFVPVVLRGLVEHLETTGGGFDGMGLLVVGSDSWFVSEHERTRDLCPEETRFVNSYGVTEATIDSSYFEGDVSGFAVDGLVPIGRPLDGERLYVLDRELEPVPQGIAGELYIGGEGVTRGYLGRPSLTAERFVPDPYSPRPGARLYRTGDRARHLPDGNVEFLGRADHQVKVRGFRVELGEIESALIEHEHVREAVVTLHDAGPAGIGRLVAYVVPEPSAAPTLASLRAHLKRRLADYMVPAAFVALDALPLLPNGKIDRRSLPAPAPVSGGSAVDYVAPTSATETRLARIWSDTLGVARVGIDDNFFELGGHSLAAMRAMSEIQRELGRSVPMAALFQDPTIRHLAAVLDRSVDASVVPVLLPLRPTGSKRPFFCVHGSTGLALNYLELAASLDRRRPIYAVQSPLLTGSEPLPTIEAMAAHYVDRVREQTDGPYLLGGHSFGGVVAFEMARQLVGRGERVGLLAILDMAAPEHALIAADPDLVAEEDRAAILTDVEAIGRLTATELRVERDDLLPLGPDQARGLAQQLRGIRNALEQRSSHDELPEGLVSVELLRGALRAAKANADALALYRPGSYSGRITLFRAKKPGAASGLSPDAFGRPDGGWDSLAELPTEIVHVSGDHFTMLTRPHVRKLARKIKTACDKADDSGVQQKS